MIVLKLLLKGLTPAALSAGRYLLVSALAAAVATARRGPWNLARRDVPWALISAVLGVALYQVLFMEGLKRTSAFASNLIQGTEPLFALGLPRVFAKAHVTARQWGGVLVALLGAGLFFVEGVKDGGRPAFGWGDLLNVVSALVFDLYGLVSAPLFSRYALRGERFGPRRLVGAAVILTGVNLARSGEEG